MTHSDEAVLCASMNGIYLEGDDVGDVICLKEGGLDLEVTVDHLGKHIFVSGRRGGNETLRICASWASIIRLGNEHALIKWILPNGSTCCQHEYRAGIYCHPEAAASDLAAE